MTAERRHEDRERIARERVLELRGYATGVLSAPPPRTVASRARRKVIVEIQGELDACGDDWIDLDRVARIRGFATAALGYLSFATDERSNARRKALLDVMNIIGDPIP